MARLPVQTAVQGCAKAPLALWRLGQSPGQTWVAVSYAVLTVCLGLLGSLGLAPVHPQPCLDFAAESIAPKHLHMVAPQILSGVQGQGAWLRLLKLHYEEAMRQLVTGTGAGVHAWLA